MATALPFVMPPTGPKLVMPLAVPSMSVAAACPRLKLPAPLVWAGVKLIAVSPKSVIASLPIWLSGAAVSIWNCFSLVPTEAGTQAALSVTVRGTEFRSFRLQVSAAAAPAGHARQNRAGSNASGIFLAGPRHPRPMMLFPICPANSNARLARPPDGAQCDRGRRLNKPDIARPPILQRRDGAVGDLVMGQPAPFFRGADPPQPHDGDAVRVIGHGVGAAQHQHG